MPHQSEAKTQSKQDSIISTNQKLSILITDLDKYTEPLQKDIDNYKEQLAFLITQKELITIQKAVKEVYVSDALKKYLVRIIKATRENDDIYLGASPRGSLGLFRMGQAFAALNGREYIIPDDLKEIAVQVLAHRIVIQPGARIKNLSPELVIQEILDQVPVNG